MLRGALTIAVALAAMPAAAAGQEIGATFTVQARLAQPDLVDATPDDANPLVARIPAGWAWSVSRGAGGAVPAPALVSHGSSGSVALPLPEQPATADRMITWTFAPL